MDNDLQQNKTFKARSKEMTGGRQYRLQSVTSSGNVFTYSSIPLPQRLSTSTGKLTTLGTDRLSPLPIEIRIMIFEALDTEQNFQGLFACRRLNVACKAAVDKTPTYILVRKEIQKILRVFGPLIGSHILDHWAESNYSRARLDKSLSMADCTIVERGQEARIRKFSGPPYSGHRRAM